MRLVLSYMVRMDQRLTMLQFDWEEVDGAEISAVMATGTSFCDDLSVRCDAIAFILAGHAVVLRVSQDTDEVIVCRESLPLHEANWHPLSQLDEIVGRKLGWCWVGRNYRGYLDSFTVAIDGIDPCYIFTGIASSLQCARVVPVTV